MNFCIGPAVLSIGHLAHGIFNQSKAPPYVVREQGSNNACKLLEFPGYVGDASLRPRVPFFVLTVRGIQWGIIKPRSVDTWVCLGLSIIPGILLVNYFTIINV